MKIRKLLTLVVLATSMAAMPLQATILTGTYGWTGTYSSSDDGSSLSGLTGSGTRMLWYPGLGVFRAGKVNSNYWDFASLGDFSFGFGYNPVASGDYSFSMGQSYYLSQYSVTIPINATGMNSFALGRGTQATGDFSFAFGDFDLSTYNSARATALHSFSFGYGTGALSNYSLAFGYKSKTSSSNNAVAIGYNANAYGYYSFSAGYSTTVSAGTYGAIAMGYQSSASKNYSLALGYSNEAGDTSSGVGAMALGFDTKALGDYSFSAGYMTLADNNTNGSVRSRINTAFGWETISRGTACFVVGANNDTTVFTSNPDDQSRPIFVVGVGSDTNNRKNGMVVYADGITDIKKIQPKGGISMGSFTAE